MRKIHLAVLSAATLAFGSLAMSARADIIANWTFETSAPVTNGGSGGITPETGTGAAFGFHAGTTAYSSPAGNGSTHSYSSTNWVAGDYYEFDSSIFGSYTGVLLTFDQTGSATGPKQFKIQYNTGSGWVDLSGGAYNVANTTGTTSSSSTLTGTSSGTISATSIGWAVGTSNAASFLSFDLSSISGLTGIRIVDNGTVPLGTSSAVGSGGTERVDNVTFSGTLATPEPATVGIAAAGAAFMIGRRRRR